MIESTEHFSFTVSNIEDTLRFFCDFLGLKATPVMEVDNEEVRRITGIADAQLRISLVQVPGNKNIELIEYVKPKGKTIDLKTCNVGVAHIAFVVDDLDKVYKDLSNKGVDFVSPPIRVPANDGNGRWAVCYVHGPDGITLEFIEKEI
jgi:catechol 2,3-dioxygenase-like lactoylglutathione lyase family enzyme